MSRKVVMNGIEARHFVAFTEDLLSYTLGSLGIDWQPKRPLNFKSAKRRRTEDFENLPPAVSADYGDAVLRLRNDLDAAFSRQISDAGAKVFDSTSNLTDFVYSRYRRYLQNPNFKHAFVVFNAFIVDLSLHCFRIGKGDLVEVIVMSMNDVYDTHLKQKFEDFGIANILA